MFQVLELCDILIQNFGELNDPFRTKKNQETWERSKENQELVRSRWTGFSTWKTQKKSAITYGKRTVEQKEYKNQEFHIYLDNRSIIEDLCILLEDHKYFF